MLHVFFHFSLRRLVENVSGGAGLAPSLPSGTFSWFVFYSLALFSPVVVNQLHHFSFFSGVLQGVRSLEFF
jgi:hypothetical protein